jgi:hypothetical protein
MESSLITRRQMLKGAGLVGVGTLLESGLTATRRRTPTVL